MVNFRSVRSRVEILTSIKKKENPKPILLKQLENMNGRNGMKAALMQEKI
jgi:hypothetical protein